MKETLPGRLPRAILLVLVFVLAGLPVLFVLLGSVRQGIKGGFTSLHLQKVFLSAAYLHPLLSTIELAVLVGLGGCLLGTVMAWLMSRHRPPGGRLLEVGIMSPVFISPFIGAIGWITLGQPNTGMLNVILARFGLPQINIVSYAGTVFIMAIFFAPYAYTLLRHSMDRLNPEMEEAAAICGANRVRAVFAIVIPLLWPSLLSAVIIIFVLSAEMFSIPGLLLVPHGYDNLSYAIYDKTTHWPIDQAEASAIGLILLLLTAIGMTIYAYSVRVQERFITIGPKSPRAPASGALTGASIASLVLILCYILFSCILPVAAIALRAMLPFFTGSFSLSDLTLANIQNTLSDDLALTSLWNSLIVTAVATVLLLAIAFFVALGRVRRPGPIATLTWIIASIPIAIPDVLIGLGLIGLYIRTPIYATLYIIILVMLARFLPVLVRLFETGLIQIGREIEEAAAICGATEARITLAIRLPLLAGTIRSAITIAGTQVFNELTASALLFTSASSVLPVVIFNYMFDGDYARAAALALVQIVILFAGLLVMGMVAFLAGIGSRRRRASSTPAKMDEPASIGRATASFRHSGPVLARASDEMNVNPEEMRYGARGKPI